MLFTTLSSAPNRTAQHTTNTIKRRALLTNLPAGVFFAYFFSFCSLRRESRGTLLLHEKINAWEIRNLLAVRFNLDKEGSRRSNERRSLFGLITRRYFLSFSLSCKADKRLLLLLHFHPRLRLQLRIRDNRFVMSDVVLLTTVSRALANVLRKIESSSQSLLTFSILDRRNYVVDIISGAEALMLLVDATLTCFSSFLSPHSTSSLFLSFL